VKTWLSQAVGGEAEDITLIHKSTLIDADDSVVSLGSGSPFVSAIVSYNSALTSESDWSVEHGTCDSSMFVQYKRNLQASRFATSTEAATELPPDFSEQSPVARMQKLEQRLASSSHQHSVPGSSTSSLCTLMKVDVFVLVPVDDCILFLNLSQLGHTKRLQISRARCLKSLGNLQMWCS